jgi:hypothetical protein
MHPSSIVRLLSASSPKKRKPAKSIHRTGGMGFAVTKRLIATSSLAINLALDREVGASLAGLAPDTTVPMDLPFARTKMSMRGRLVGQSPVEVIDNTQYGIAILDIGLETEEIFQPNPIVIRMGSRYSFDHKVRTVDNLGSIVHYVGGFLYGEASNGLIQVKLNSTLGIGSLGAPVWDEEASAVIGMLFYALPPDYTTAFMVPAAKLSEAWPELNRSAIAERPKVSGRRLFICHASEDLVAARELFERMREFGYDPWLDKEKLLVGQNWDLEIRSAVKQARFFLLLLSRKSVSKRGYLQREFKMAFEAMKELPEGTIYLLPVKLDDCLIPHQFSSLEWVDLRGERSFGRIKQAIEFRLSQEDQSEA